MNRIIPDPYSIESIIFLIFVVISSYQIYFVLRYFSYVAFYRRKKRQENISHKKLSVVVILSSSYDDIYDSLIKSFYSQDIQFNQLEILIPYMSKIESAKFDKKHLPKNKKINVKFIEIFEEPNHLSVNKFLQFIATKSASFDSVLVTSSTIFPLDKNWLNNIVSNIDTNKQYVLSYTSLLSTKYYSSFYDMLAYFHKSLLSLSFAFSGNPYVGDRFNTVISKNDYLSFNNFPKYYLFNFSEQTLFFNRKANKNNLSIDIRHSSIVRNIYSPPKSLVQIEKREFRQSFYSLKTKTKFALFVYHMSYILGSIFFIMSLLIFDIKLTCLIFAIKAVIAQIVLQCAYHKLESKIFSLRLILFNSFMFFSSIKFFFKYAIFRK